MDTPKEIARSAELQKEVTRVRVEFLNTDLDTSMTFARTALDARDDLDKKTRNTVNARRGYDTVRGFMAKMYEAGEKSQARELEPKLAQLRSLLEDLGESFTP